MSAPRRQQRSRAEGWRWPEGAKYVGRPGAFANPFPWNDIGRAAAVALFDRWLDGELDAADLATIGRLFPSIEPGAWLAAMKPRRLELLRRIEELRGHDLLCWCGAGEPCHGDSLIRRANAIRLPGGEAAP